MEEGEREDDPEDDVEEGTNDKEKATPATPDRRQLNFALGISKFNFASRISPSHTDAHGGQHARARARSPRGRRHRCRMATSQGGSYMDKHAELIRNKQGAGLPDFFSESEPQNTICCLERKSQKCRGASRLEDKAPQG